MYFYIPLILPYSVKLSIGLNIINLHITLTNNVCYSKIIIDAILFKNKNHKISRSTIYFIKITSIFSVNFQLYSWMILSFIINTVLRSTCQRNYWHAMLIAFWCYLRYFVTTLQFHLLNCIYFLTLMNSPKEDIVFIIDDYIHI